MREREKEGCGCRCGNLEKQRKRQIEHKSIDNESGERKRPRDSEGEVTERGKQTETH